MAEEDAPRLGYLELLQGHPSDISQADKAQAAEAREQAAAATEAARAQVLRWAELAWTTSGFSMQAAQSCPLNPHIVMCACNHESRP